MTNTDDPRDYGNADLSSDDDMGQNASDMGVIQDEDDELDVTRISFQSNINNSPPPESADLEDDEDDQDEDIDDLFFDLETEMEFDLEEEEE